MHKQPTIDAPLRIGIVGAGRIVECVHLPVLRAMPDVVVAGLYDPAQEHAQALARSFEIAHVCRSPQELFDLGLDIALVACPNHLHAAMSIAALEAGVHVVCEKPMATSYAMAQAMIAAATASRRELMVAFTNRFRPEIGALWQMIQDGQFGKIHAIRSGWLRRHGIPGAGTWFTNQEQAGGGVLTDLGSHLIDLALYLSGRPPLLTASCVLDRTVDLQAQASWYTPAAPSAASACNVEVSASAFMVFQGPLNLFLEVSWDWAVPYDQTYLHLIGERGIARLDTLFGLSPSGRRPEYPLQVWIAGQAQPQPIRGVLDVLQPYRQQWRFFIDSLLQGRSLRSCLHDSLATVQVIEALYESAQQSTRSPDGR